MSAGARGALLACWLAVLAGLAAYVASNLRVGTDLRSFMPPAQTPQQRLLLDEIGEGPGSRLLLVALAGDAPDVLADVSKRLAATLRTDARFVRVLNGETDLDAVGADLLPYRYLLSPTLDAAHFDTTFLRTALEQRVEDLGSPASAWLKPLLARDPTLETLKLAEAWAPPHEPERHGEVWFGEHLKYALLLVETAAPGFDPAAQRDAVAALETAFAVAAQGSRATLEASGPGAFAVRVHATTSDEANRIGIVDSIGFLTLLLLAYRRFSTVLAGALPLVSGGLAGTAALALVFGGAHGITLAFGFTLIGVAQDYPIHLFSHLRPGTPATAVARRLWPTLSTGIASTCIAYLAFFASGVDGLEQLAVFTAVGLATAGVTTRFLLAPLLGDNPRDVADSRFVARADRLFAKLRIPIVVLAVIPLWSLYNAIDPRATPFWENNLAALTPVPKELLVRDAALRRELGAPDVRYLLVIEAPDADGVLAASERLESDLASLRTRGALAGYELPSRYLPSAATQRARQAALPDADTLRASLAEASAGLPFKPGLFEPFLADVAAARALAPVDAQTFAASPLGLRVKAMLQPRDGHWVGLVNLVGVTDVAALAALGEKPDSPVRLLDLKTTSESLVATYRTRVLWSLAIASLLLVGVVAFALRRPARIVRVLVPMLLSTVMIVGGLRLFDVSLSLFHLVALILAAGLGLDYALFFEHADDDEREQRRTLHAILVCSATTFLVFFLLALSSLPVLRAIGVTVSLGVVFNFVFALAISRGPRRSPHVS